MATFDVVQTENEAAQAVEQIKNTIPLRIDEIDVAMAKLTQYKVDFASEQDKVDELDNMLTWGKTQLQTIIDKY